MKRLFIVILVAAVAWSVYWFVGASSSRTAFTNWFDDRRNEGWVAEYTNFSLMGFPNRFDATWEGLAVADPESGIAIEMPQFQILALSYRPTHVIAVAPHEMLLATPTDKFDVQSDTLRASLRLKPGPALELERAVLEGSNMRLSGAASASLGELHMATQRTAESSYRYGLEATELTPPLEMLRGMLGDAALPEVMQAARLDAVVTYDRPWDISSLDVARPQPTRIDLRTVQGEWGVMALQARGAVDIDEAGRPTGELAIQATHWRDMLEIARKSGALADGAASMVTGVLNMAAQSSGHPDKLDLTITFRDGQSYIGLIPLGPAPVFRLR